ncbi:MAG: hypothetical protein ABI858_03570 [Pseudoxanthomonas sp.]
MKDALSAAEAKGWFKCVYGFFAAAQLSVLKAWRFPGVTFPAGRMALGKSLTL